MVGVVFGCGIGGSFLAGEAKLISLELLAESGFAGSFLACFESEIVVVLTFEIVISHSFRNFEFKISANLGENKAKVTFCG